jgi:hypothetical protein
MLFLLLLKTKANYSITIIIDFENNNSILYTKVEKFMIKARAPRLEPEARRGL